MEMLGYLVVLLFIFETPPYCFPHRLDEVIFPPKESEGSLIDEHFFICQANYSPNKLFEEVCV